MEVSTRSPLLYGAAALVAALVLALGVSRCQVTREREARAAAALRADSIDAENDTTRRVLMSERERVRLLGDSLAVVERRAVQVPQIQSALDSALGRERILKADLAAVVRESHTVTGGTVTESTDNTRATGREADSVAVGQVTVRRGSFDVRDEPYTARAIVELPAPPARGSIDLRIRLDTARISVRPGCGAPDASGIRPATVAVSGPVWLGITLERVEQDPSLCRSPALVPRGVSRSRWAAIGAGVGFAAGFYLGVTAAK